jgi:hypothetical protein
MRVQLLYADGDPDAMRARQNLVEVLTEDAFETPIQMVVVGSQADAELLAFPGSPTIRLDDQDIDPEHAPAGFALRKRSYPGADGRLDEPFPSKALIRAALERARGWGHGRG